MHESPATRASLLVRLRDGGDAEAWQEFVHLYAPIIYGFARKRGLQDADAADLMQEILRSVSSAVHRLEYDSARGTFRGWLFTVTRNKVFNFLESRGRRERPRTLRRRRQIQAGLFARWIERGVLWRWHRYRRHNRKDRRV